MLSPVILVALALSPPVQPPMQDDDLEDMRPQARAFIEAVRARPPGVTVAEAQGRSLAKPDVGQPPATIRVWRRKLDGSTDSCQGRVDVVPFEDYVKGVVPHEWLVSWDPKSLEMGAVCVRSFAWAWIKAGGKYDCADLDDSTASQVYKDDRDPKTDGAVDRTRGVVIVRDGALVMAEYSAENGSPTKFGVVEPYCEGHALNGHGRGTCQWGTQRWATKEGKDYVWMVPHYYPGATVSGALAPAVPSWRDEVTDLDFPAEMTSGQEATVTVDLENSGARAWDGLVRLGTSSPRDRASAFARTGAWIDPTRPAPVPMLDPNGHTRVSFAIVAPEVTEARRFDERFELVHGNEWFGDDGAVALSIRVVPRAAGPTMTNPPGPTAPPSGDDNDDGVGDATGGCGVGGRASASGTALLALLALLRTTRRRRR